MKTSIEAVEWMIDIVKAALDEGLASASDLEDWLLAAITQEELALENVAHPDPVRTFSSSLIPTGTLH